MQNKNKTISSDIKTYERSEFLRLSVDRNEKMDEIDLCKAWSPQISPFSIGTPEFIN